MMAEQLENKDGGPVLNISLVTHYAYGQVPFDKEPAKHCDFQTRRQLSTGIFHCNGSARVRTNDPLSARQTHYQLHHGH